MKAIVRAAAVVCTVLVLALAAAVPALADNEKNVEVAAEDPGSPDSGGVPVKHVPCPTDPGTGKEACSYGSARWNGSCYTRLVSPQPAANSPQWEGHLDAAGNPDGVMVMCMTQECAIINPDGPDLEPGNIGAGGASQAALCAFERHWAAAAPGVVSPRVLAQRAVASERR